jgi:hypothetical protein
MGIFNRNELWDTLDDINSYNRSAPRNGRWGKRGFGAAMGVIFLLVLIGIFGHSQDEQLKQTWNKVKAGDLLYADSIYLRDSTFTQLHTYRRVRPINAADINKMRIAKWEKLKKIARLDTSTQHNRPVMLSSNLLFLQDDMFKQSNACIGTYLKSDSTTGDIEENKDLYFPQKWYAIRPNRLLCQTGYVMNMPVDYTFADEYYYVEPLSVSLTQPSIFMKKKIAIVNKDKSTTLSHSSKSTKKKTTSTKKHRSKIKRRHR